MLRDPIAPTNTLIVARGGRSAGRLRRTAPTLPTGCGRPRQRRPAALARPLSGGGVYTDDRAPVEWLIDQSIVDYAAED